MFTGLIETVGDIIGRVETPGGIRLQIGCALASELGLGDSVAVNGVCLTVISCDARGFAADVGPETMRVTTLGGLKQTDLVNLERPLRADSRLGGHFVQGHVDAVGRIEQLKADADFHWLTVKYPEQLAPFLIPKGSIAVDGISLTVADLRNESFVVQLVPFTMEHTNLQRARDGDAVNLECDMVGKYVARAVELAARTIR
jgi:riboflavin synthase